MTYLFGRATSGGKKWLEGKTAKKVHLCVSVLSFTVQHSIHQINIRGS